MKKIKVLALAVASVLIGSNAIASDKSISETIEVEYTKPFDDLVIEGTGPNGKFETVEFIDNGNSISSSLTSFNVTQADSTKTQAKLSSSGLFLDTDASERLSFTAMTISPGPGPGENANGQYVDVTDCKTGKACTTAVDMELTISGLDMAESGYYSGVVNLEVRSEPSA